jgi:hypothetical protein
MIGSNSTSPRRWGVWCDDPAAEAWLRALAEQTPAPTFVAVRLTPEHDAVWHGIAGVSFVSDWQTLLVDRTLEAIFVTGISEDRLTAMRRLAEQDRPLWIWPDARHGLPFAYELALIANDRPDQLHGVWRHRGELALQAIAAHEAGELQHLEFLRKVGGDALADNDIPAVMQRHLLPDLDLVRWLGATATRVTSLRTTDPNGRLWKQSALLAADSGPGLTWTGEIVSGVETAARLEMRTANGVKVLVEDPQGHWSVKEESVSAPAGGLAAGVEWADVVRVFEWFDACDHSLERKRTIELHSEPVSERTVFKTQMTAIGCLMLMATLLFALVYLAMGVAVGDVKEAPAWLIMTMNVLRLLIFAPLAVFLLAQLLLPLARAPRPRNSQG